MADTAAWPGVSGKEYVYWVTPIGTPLKAEPGNYVFAKQGPNGKWYAVHIGETEDLSAPLLDPDAEECIRRNGATHLHTHTAVGPRQVRQREATDLKLRWRPKCS
ncbi:MAG: hypothetical protein WAJ85_06330 [Candidatus Baltobacteraceae bacterium]|jgi:hypothetical protein